MGFGDDLSRYWDFASRFMAGRLYNKSFPGWGLSDKLPEWALRRAHDADCAWLGATKPAKAQYPPKFGS